ncbi:Uncharacterized protein GBIM_01530 [Gryllus bimaculatus]|nr:Uncharacterized protein GBIM_01530 [Gryllus bimaculatus]
MYIFEVSQKQTCVLLGAAAASRLYVEAISKLARQAQQGTWGGSSDIDFDHLFAVKLLEIRFASVNVGGNEV